MKCRGLLPVHPIASKDRGCEAPEAAFTLLTENDIRDSSVTGRLTNRLNAALERRLPEKRVFLKSDTETRFIRLRPLTQAALLAGTTLVVGWTILSSAVFVMDAIGAGGVREQARREQMVYEARLNDLSDERDQRAAEASAAHERFNVALGGVSDMQTALLSSEDRRKELETGLEVVRQSLRKALTERDDARTQLALLQTEVDQKQDEGLTAARLEDERRTLDYLTAALSTTASERDKLSQQATEAQQQADMLALEKRLMQDRNEQIFARLEEAVSVSMEPLDKMFKSVGLSASKVITEVKRGYNGQGGPLVPMGISTKSSPLDADTERANGVLGSLDQINLYRMAAEKVPFALPLQTAFRYSSGFGGRSDPFRKSRARHDGVDMAGAHGSPILSTGEGVVTFAGWASGYGNLVKIQHDFGLETRYGHMSKIRVKVGQKVSRGDRIGDMGSTGRSTGTHLHYEVRVGGTPVNPMTYIKAAQDVF